MATLVLSTVGTALGGPLGGALGSLVGQSIDQGLFGPGIRKGPRLGDLSVQTSSYGSPIPRIYGTMRVAGTVIWSTDILENDSIEGGGKGSPEYVAYRYSASFAVALSSRPVLEVRRIWADGKLIRGAAGDFKVKTKFRLCQGSEDQPADPLIASIETIANAPAYRGLALAVFEDLDLGEFGNRIPVLTFEVVADEAISIGEVLADASGGLIDASDDRSLPGYAAHGASIGDSLAVLIDLCGVELAERDGKLRSPLAAAPVVIEDRKLGCDADGSGKSRVERHRAPNSELPYRLSMTYYDPERDYQAGQMCASAGRGTKGERVELPAVLTGAQAKATIEQALARRYRAADRFRISLAPAYMWLRPGDAVQHPDLPSALTIRSLTVDALTVDIEAEARPTGMLPLPADPGRSNAEPDVPVGRSEVALFEGPATGDALSDFPVAYVAVSADGHWKGVPLELQLGTAPLPALAIQRKAVLGHAQTVLANRSPRVMDELSTVTVKLIDGSRPLLNADDDALMGGANLAMLGAELLQFGRADEISPGLFRLSRLLRGRRGTEWATDRHSVGERFCIIDQGITPVEQQPSAVGLELTAIAHGVGDTAPLPEARRQLTGEAMRPPSPCHLKTSLAGGILRAEWIRRSHLAWTWLDEVGAPDDPFAERYRVSIDGAGGSVTMETDIPFIQSDAADLPFGPGETVRLSVVTVGPKAVSPNVSTTLTF